MARTRGQEIGVGALFIVALGLLAYASVRVGAIRSFEEQLRATVRLPDAAGLSEGAPVKIAGVEVGVVSSMQPVDGQAELILSLDADAAIRTDALVQVRARSALGEKFVAISPTDADTAPLLADGGTLTNTIGTTEIDQLVNAMSPLLSEVDPQALSKAIDALAAALESDPQRLERMLADAETLLHNAALASEEAPALVADARAAAATVRRLGDEVRPLSQQARSTLRQIDTIAVEAGGAVQDARTLMADTRVAVQGGTEVLDFLNENAGDIELIIDNVKEIDRWELRRLLREEGIRLRLRSHDVDPPPSSPSADEQPD